MGSVAHPNAWKRKSVTSAPSSAPLATSEDECTPVSTRVCATSNAMMKVTDEMRNLRGESSRTRVTAIHPANATAACPDGSPPRSGVPRPVYAFTAITRMHRDGERDERQLGRRVGEPREERELRVATSPENTR